MTRTRKRLLLLWVVLFAVSMAAEIVEDIFNAWDRFVPGLEPLSNLTWIGFWLLTCFWLVLFIRWALRRLFWRVGRRLVLSYFLIGVLPLILFTILVIFLGYTIAGVLSQSRLRAERQSYLAQLDLWNADYAMTGTRPPAAFPTLAIHDTDGTSAAELPQWLVAKPFNGILVRNGKAVLASSRRYGKRTVVLLQPLDRHWHDYMKDKRKIILAWSVAREDRDDRDRRVGNGGVRVQVGNSSRTFEADTNDEETNATFKEFFESTPKLSGVIWGDLSPNLPEWDTGTTEGERRLLTFIWNPWTNLFDYYLGSGEYARAMFGAIGGIATTLLVMYLPATLLATVLIFSISRAVNRIEKGTRAVERGDFTYRIRMKPTNQLGEMAQSFDRMTESISSLLTKVAEKERLETEIDIAASIQRNLLPSQGPKLRGVSFSAHFEPTAQIGGDYYDVFNIDQNRVAVAIGDVSGHGLSTGLVMAMVKAAITTLVEEGADEESLFRRLNDLVFRSTERRSFMTLGFTIFDLAQKTIRHTNAGHLYPYIVCPGKEPVAIESPSLPLGMREAVQPHTVTRELGEGDTVVYLSDGIIEAQNPAGEPFGFERVEQIMKGPAAASPAELQIAILDDLARHTAGRPSEDDRTVMILRFDELVV